jgi:cytosine/adenosine deaminase-related metal-dependent hydrolase
MGTLRIRGGRVASIGPPERNDVVIDLRGDRVLPGLVNAHDHLHRNHYPRLKYQPRYRNVSEWSADIDSRRANDAVLASCASVPRADSLLIGGLKNLLSGVTTVAHHDAAYPEMHAAEFPVFVPASFGWAHSLALDGETRVRQSHAATPADVPWFIHAGEGKDAAAASELQRLDALGVLEANTVLVHGVALDAVARARLIDRGVGLVWCPGSNHYLLGQSADVKDLVRHGLVALGSDSRLSGERDLLDELRFARSLGEVSDEDLELLVTTRAARLLKLADRGSLQPDTLADFIVLPREARLGELRRADLRCVCTSGEMRYGDHDLADVLLTAASRVPVMVDGRAKCVDARVAKVLRRPSVHEPGVELVPEAMRAA